MFTLRVYDAKGRKLVDTTVPPCLNDAIAMASRTRDGDRFECLEQCKPERNYGYGAGLSPVMVGSC